MRCDIKVRFKKESPYGEVTQVLTNITEIHYGYFSVMGDRVAFESDYEHTGVTYDIGDIAEFETFSVEEGS